MCVVWLHALPARPPEEIANPLDEAANDEEQQHGIDEVSDDSEAHLCA